MKIVKSKEAKRLEEIKADSDAQAEEAVLRRRARLAQEELERRQTQQEEQDRARRALTPRRLAALGGNFRSEFLENDHLSMVSNFSTTSQRSQSSRRNSRSSSTRRAGETNQGRSFTQETGMRSVVLSTRTGVGTTPRRRTEEDRRARYGDDVDDYLSAQARGTSSRRQSQSGSRPLSRATSRGHSRAGLLETYRNSDIYIHVFIIIFIERDTLNEPC